MQPALSHRIIDLNLAELRPKPWLLLLGGSDRLVTIAASCGEMAAQCLQQLVVSVLHLPLEEARIATEDGAIRLLVSMQQVEPT